MTHPSDQLLSYALGELSLQEQEQLEQHLKGCQSCLRELHLIQDSLVSLVETLPRLQAPKTSWNVIQKRLNEVKQIDSVSEIFTDGATRPKSENVYQESTKLENTRRLAFRWQTFALAASLILFASGLFWGFQQRQNYLLSQAEQSKVAGWLSRPDVSSQQLLDSQGERIGSVLTLSDGRALIILRTPPKKGLAYQAWGEVNNQRVSLGLSQRTLLEVPYEGYESIGVSLEPAQGSPQPTQTLSNVPTL